MVAQSTVVSSFFSKLNGTIETNFVLVLETPLDIIGSEFPFFDNTFLSSFTLAGSRVTKKCITNCFISINYITLHIFPLKELPSKTVCMVLIFLLFCWLWLRSGPGTDNHNWDISQHAFLDLYEMFSLLALDSVWRFKPSVKLQCFALWINLHHSFHN